MGNRFFALGACLFVLLGQSASGATSEYVFITEQSEIVQTGGFAGVYWTYALEGRFRLAVDLDAGIASFTLADANAAGNDQVLDPNAVFNMTSLTDAAVSDTSIRFTGNADDGSSVLLTLTLEGDLALLSGQTTPPAGSADFFVFSLDAVAQRKYAGGIGEPNDPYQIATAAELIALSETPEDYDKHFILTADIDLDPNLPGGRVFDKAVIAPHIGFGADSFLSEPSFTGVFDGDGHVISHLTIKGSHCLGLFGTLGPWGSPTAEVRNLGVAAVNIAGSWYCVGAVVGIIHDQASVIQCHSTGTVFGRHRVGGLVGESLGTVIQCYSTAKVRGTNAVGGLVGFNPGMFYGCGRVAYCYSTGAVKGDVWIGGLVGASEGEVVGCYSTGTVAGYSRVGGLVGDGADLTNCYSTGAVTGTGQHVGGLAGYNYDYGSVTNCFWDTQTSGQTASAAGMGKTTAQMQTVNTFLEAGWDFLGETVNGTEETWWILEGKDYPRLWWEKVLGDDSGDGEAGPSWFVYALDPESTWLEETNGRLEAYTTGEMEDVDAIYVAPANRTLRRLPAIPLK